MQPGMVLAIEWLGDLGVEFYDALVYGGDEPVPRVHVPIGRGQGVVDVLHRACRDAGVDRLVVDDGAVAGVAVGDDRITAGAVVIATGGFANAPELLAEHFPSAAATGSAWYIGADGSRGDALRLAEQVDAQLVGHDRGGVCERCRRVEWRHRRWSRKRRFGRKRHRWRGVQQ